MIAGGEQLRWSKGIRKGGTVRIAREISMDGEWCCAGSGQGGTSRFGDERGEEENLANPHSLSRQSYQPHRSGTSQEVTRRDGRERGYSEERERKIWNGEDGQGREADEERRERAVNDFEQNRTAFKEQMLGKIPDSDITASFRRHSCFARSLLLSLIAASSLPAFAR